MSEFHVVVVQIGEIVKHPNADTLSITTVLNGYPVILKTGWLQPGDLAVYIPIDSVMPLDDPEYEYLGPSRNVKAKRLRGIFSMGMLAPAKPGWIVGLDVQAEMGITKWEPPIENVSTKGDNEPNQDFFHKYTDIEGLRRYLGILQVGEEVVLNEKLHGTNSRFLFAYDRLWVGSHGCIKKRSDDVVWWKIVAQYGLEEKLKNHPNVAIYGEVYGAVQDLKYSCKSGEIKFAMFDAKDIKTGVYLDYDPMVALAKELGVDTVPELYRGPWDPSLKSLAEGKSTLADHVREGWVARPVHERLDMVIGRIILKYHGEGYLTRKGA